MNPEGMNSKLRDNTLMNPVNLEPSNDGSSSVRQLLGHIWTMSGTISLDLIDDTLSREGVFIRMKEETKLKIALQRKKMNLIMYERLRNRRVGTHEVESIA